MQEMQNPSRGKKHSKVKTRKKKGQVSGLGKASSLSGIYIMNSDMSSSDSEVKISSKSRGSKWDLSTHELQERFLYKHTHPFEHHHHGTTFENKSMKNKAGLDAAQLSDLNDFDMFPPLGTHLKMIKSGKGSMGASRHTEQHEVAKKSFDDCHKVFIKSKSSQPKTKKGFEASEGENISERKAHDIKKEKVFSPQANDRKEAVALFHECSESNLLSQSKTGLNKSVKTMNVTVSGEELCLNMAQKTNVNGGCRKSTESCQHSTKTILCPGKTLTDYSLTPEKSHMKKVSSQNLHISLEKNTNANKTLEYLETCSGKDLRKSDEKQHSSSLLDPLRGKYDSPGAEPSSFTEAASSSPSKHRIISYLKMFLEKQKLQSLLPADNSPESERFTSQQCPYTDDPLIVQDTAYVRKSMMSEEESMAEYDKVLEEILDHYIVISNFPYMLTRNDILYHIRKVGFVSHFIMDGNRAHVIFLKAEDAEKAFGLRHVLCGKELAVYRPKRPSCTLYLSGLTINTPNEEVVKVVSRYGVILGFYRPLHKVNSGPAGYCFIKVDEKVAEDILMQSSLVVNNVKIFAEVSSQSEVKFISRISSIKQPGFIFPSSPSAGSSREYKVILTDVPEMASYDSIKEHFQEFGRLQKVFLKNRRGFVIFASRDSLEQALSTRHIIMGTEVKLSQSSLVP